MAEHERKFDRDFFWENFDEAMRYTYNPETGGFDYKPPVKFTAETRENMKKTNRERIKK